MDETTTKTLREAKINNEDIINTTEHSARKITRNKLQTLQVRKALEASTTKSKVEHYATCKSRESTTGRAKYMNTLSRRECAALFSVRSRMLPVKSNYKSTYPNQSCRWCDHKWETQEHILTECEAFKSFTDGTKYSTFFDDNEDTARTASKIALQVIQEIKNAQD